MPPHFAALPRRRTFNTLASRLARGAPEDTGETDGFAEQNRGKSRDAAAAPQKINEKQLIEPPDVRNLVHLRRPALARDRSFNQPVLLGQIPGNNIAVPLQR